MFLNDVEGTSFSDKSCDLALKQSVLYQVIMAAVLLLRSDFGIVKIGDLARLVNNADEISLKVIKLVKKELDRQRKT